MWRDLSVVLIVENNKEGAPHDIVRAVADLTIIKPIDLSHIVKQVSEILG